MEAFTTDPLLASEHIRSVWERVRAFDQALSASPVALDPFRGQTTIGKTWREELLVSRDFEPIRGPLLAFFDYLLERRLNLGVSSAESAALLGREYPPRAPFEEPGTLAERRLLALRASSDPQRKDEARLAWRTLAELADDLSAARVLYYERRVEIEGRLGASLSPLVGWGEPGQGVPELGQALLTGTEDAAQALLEPGFFGLVHAATAYPALEGWPARLAADSLLELLDGSWLSRAGLPARASLPERLCPSSFVRAAVHLGRQLVLAATPLSLPFVCARTPGEVYGRTLGRLFGLWLLSDAFARRHLGLGPAERRSHARGRAQLLLAEGRLLATRCLLAEAGRQSQTRLKETWNELGLRLCGEPWGPALGLLSAPAHAPADLVAHAWALSLERELVQTFDEDYLDNPRAREAILAALHAPEPTPPPYAVLHDAALALLSGLAGC